MEVLLVLVILVILGSFATVAIRRARQTALHDAARAQIAFFDDALQLYDLHVRSYPSTSQSLRALIERPSGLANESRRTKYCHWTLGTILTDTSAQTPTLIESGPLVPTAQIPRMTTSPASRWTDPIQPS